MKKEEIIPNTIYYTNNLSTITQVIDKIDEVKNTDMDKMELIKLLGIYTINKCGIVLVSFKEDKENINGGMIISRRKDKWGQYLFIDLAWIDPHCPNLRRKFQEEIILACKTRGIKRVQAVMKRGFKAMHKLYGFKEINRTLETEVS